MKTQTQTLTQRETRHIHSSYVVGREQINVCVCVYIYGFGRLLNIAHNKQNTQIYINQRKTIFAKYYDNLN